MTDRAVNQLKTCLNGALAYLFDLLGISETLDMLVSAEFEVYTVGIIYKLLSGVLAYKCGQIAADLVAERQLSVRKCTGSRKACCYMTIFLWLPSFSISIAVKIPAGPAPTITTSAFIFTVLHSEHDYPF